MKKLKVNREIQLKELGFEDVDKIFSIIDRERAYLGEWLPFVAQTKEPADTHLFVEDYINSAGRELTFAILYRKELVGLIGLKDIDTGNKSAEIGYWLSEKFQHKGIVTAACKALITYAFESMDMNRIQLRAAIGNMKSRHIAERLGFTHEGIEREGELHERGFVDLVVYGLLKKEFKNQ